MSRTFEGFEEFVAELWPDLEGVAFVVTLDAAVARQVTTAALTSVHQHWREALDEGRPGWMARRSVLSAAVGGGPTPGRSGSPATAQSPFVPYRPDAGRLTGTGDLPDGDDAVLTALEVVVRAATPLERALVGAGSVWRMGPDEVAELLGMPVVDVREADAALRTRLVAALDAARAAPGPLPGDGALDVDLDAVVERLLTGLSDPPDLAALGVERHRAVRRRSLVAAGAGVAVAGAAAWWLWPDGPPASAGSASTGPSPRTLPPPDDPSWASLSRWAPRGRLATDPGVQGLAISRASGVGPRVLWADDVAGRRLVISGSLEPGAYEDLVLQAWHGPAGADPASLEKVHLTTGLGYENSAVIPLALPTYPGALLVVLARPTVTTASYSPTVLPFGAGVIERAWTDMALTSGIGSTTWAQEPGPALRVRCGDFDGPAASTAPTWLDHADTASLAGFAEGTSRFVAAATGLPIEQVHTEVVTDATVAETVIDPAARSPQDGAGHVRVLRTTTSTGALIRSVRVVAGPMRIVEGRSTMNSLEIEPPAVLPADTPADEPVVSRLDDLRPGVNRYLVIAPGAARVQLLSTSSTAHLESKMTATRDGVAIVVTTFAGEAADLRLVRHDTHGRRFGTSVLRDGRDLLDL
ncbi:MAG TPA: hypothetical protein VFL10_10540 [Ornithinibacter sp.]|nr:hypothetical protein [Ornithinibacter sp.]